MALCAMRRNFGGARTRGGTLPCPPQPGYEELPVIPDATLTPVLPNRRTMRRVECGEGAAAHRLCVAPMMAWTDRHCRYLHRLLAPGARLYTEMISTDALLHGDAARLLAFSAEERPLALQLGGSDPGDLASAARLAAAAGFDEVNLNVGCPSERVRKGAIGACLMREPRRVADCVAAMRDAVPLPVTVKCRLGLVERLAELDAPASEESDYAFLRDFVGWMAQAGARAVVVHARKAVLQGLTPAQNRAVPPLRHALVRRLKQDFPRLPVIVNGGIRDIATARRHLEWADGVMIGRAAYRNPCWLGELNAALFGGAPMTAPEAIAAYRPYVERSLREGVQLRDMTRHMLTLCNGMRGARRFRRHLSDRGSHRRADVGVLEEAVALVAA